VNRGDFQTVIEHLEDYEMTARCRQMGVLSVVILVMALGISMGASTATVEKAPSVTADQALATLQAGNARFAAGKAENPRSTLERVKETADRGQFPIVTILSCSDSRVPVERIFDQGVGDMFVVRVAGNVADTDEIGTIEYGTAHLSTPLVVVLGHTACGAVTAVATDAEAEGNLASLLDHIRPAVDKAREEFPDKSAKDLVPAATKNNIWQSIEDILTTSDVVANEVKDGKVKIVGALYDISTGKVEWMGPHPDEDKLIGVEKAKPASAPAPAATPVAAPAAK
jgi:carbonic anhydrase